MGVFDDKHVVAAIDRLKLMSTKAVRDMLEHSRTLKIGRLEEACESELALRPFEFDGDAPARFEQMAAKVVDMSLVDAVRYAFGTELPINPAELSVIRWIARHPGTTFNETLANYGKRDLGLVIGHLVYERYGCFRKFMDPRHDQSSVLLRKDHSGPSVRYWLHPEAEVAFRELGFI